MRCTQDLYKKEALDLKKVIKRNIGKETKQSQVMMSNYVKKYKNMKAWKSQTFWEYALHALA